MSYEYSKLKGRIIEVCGSQIEFAKALGCSCRTLSLKMTNKRAWKQSEITRALEILNIDEEEIPDYFFKKKVQNIEQKTY